MFGFTLLCFHNAQGGPAGCQQHANTGHHIQHGQCDFPRCHSGADLCVGHGIGGGNRINYILGSPLHMAHHCGIGAPILGGTVCFGIFVQSPIIFVGIQPQVRTGSQTGNNILVEHGRDRCLVCNDGTFKTPFLPEHMGHQTLVGTGPGSAQTVHGSHGRIGITQSDCQFKALQEDLTDSLLVGKHSTAITVGLLIVQGKMLHVSNDTLAPGTLDLRTGHLTGQEAVFGEVFKISAGVGRPVDIDTGGIPACHTGGDGILTDALAQPFHQLRIPGRGHHHFHRVGHGALAAYQGAGNTGGTVLILGRGQADGIDLNGCVAAQTDQAHGLLRSQLLQQLLPGGIVIVLAHQLDQFQFAAVFKGGHRLGTGADHIHTALPFQIRQKLGRRVPHTVLIGGGHGSGPVAAGQVSKTGVIHPDIHIIKPVGDRISGNAAQGISGIVLLCDRVLMGKSGVAVSGHAIGNGITLGCQNVIQGIMGIIACRKIIITGIDNIGFRAVGVIGLHQFLGNRDSNGFLGTGIQQLGLGKAYQFYCGFLDAIVPVILGIGRLHIDLHHILAGGAAGVGHGNRNLESIRFLGHLVVGPCEIRIAKAVAKGELNRFRVLVVTGISLAQHRVLIPGLVITIAYINTFGINQVIVAVANAGIADGVIPQVLGRRGTEAVIGIGIHQMTGGVDFTGQRLGHRVNALLANTAGPQASLDIGIGRILQEAQFNGVIGIDHDHNIREVLTGHGQQVQLVLIRLQIQITGSQRCSGNVRAFTAGATDTNHSRVTVLCKAGNFRIGVDIARHFIYLEITFAGFIGH